MHERWRRWLVVIVLTIIIPLHILATRQKAEGEEKLQLLRSLQASKVAAVAVHTKQGRPPMCVIDDPDLLGPFITAMNELQDYSLNHPGYTVPWYVVVHLRDGQRIELKCDLMSWPNKTIYVKIVETGFGTGYQADALSSSLYTWLLAHSWRNPETDLNAIVKHDWALMHLAAMGGHKDIIELLLAQGADINVLSKVELDWHNPDTPLDLVTRYDKHDRMISFFRERGAKRARELGR